MDAGGLEVKLQFNPARMISSAAKLSKADIAKRRCFLCRENRPPEQMMMEFDGRKGKKYHILVNPYPIFPDHLVIAAAGHTDQSILTRYVDMLDLAAKYRGYTFYYNGPRSGASAPDHHHFQAIPDGLIPLVNDVDENGNELETTHYRSDIFYSKEGLREFVYSYVPAQSKETQNADPANPGIKMDFSHPFAAVSFHLGQSYRMTLHDITLSNIKYEGVYKFDEGWSVYYTSDDQTGKPKVGDLWIEVEKGIPTPINFNSPIGGPYLVAPQILDDSSSLIVSYTRLDAQKETKSVRLNSLGADKWEAGRHYVYTLGLGNNEEEILFQVKVEKWTVIDYKNEVDVE